MVSQYVRLPKLCRSPIEFSGEFTLEGWAANLEIPYRLGSLSSYGASFWVHRSQLAVF